MSQWLQNFAYRISLRLEVFVLAAFLSVAACLITVSSQAIKAALANPVETLRYE
jgi:putative ABC transport system permease protein